jgi:hypothetical protein
MPNKSGAYRADRPIAAEIPLRLIPFPLRPSAAATAFGLECAPSLPFQMTAGMATSSHSRGVLTVRLRCSANEKRGPEDRRIETVE